MTAFASLSEVINRVSGGNSGTPEHLNFARLDRTQAGAAAAATVAGRLQSLWGIAGYPAGVDVSAAGPGAAANPTNSTSGTLKQANPGGGRQKWLLGLEAVANQVGTLILYDRLMHVSALSGTSTSAQTFTGTLSRYTGGGGNQIYVEIYVALGATPTTITASYTNQAAASGKTTAAVAIGGTGLNEAGRMIALPLAAGDTGVQSVQSVTLAASTGTVGDFGVTIAHQLAMLSMSQIGAGFARDFVTGLPSLPEIVTNAALALAWLPGGTSFPQIVGLLHSAEN